MPPSYLCGVWPGEPSFGSWQWIGADIGAALAQEFEVCFFRELPPPCDIAVFVKFKPDAATLRKLPCRVVYCPVEVYGAAAEIDADAAALCECDLAITHSRSLEKYFSSYLPTCYIDHHLKYVSQRRQEFRRDGSLLWIGNDGNLPPVIDWVNRRKLEEELWILTNFAEGQSPPSPSELGFSAHNRVRVDRWTEERHLAWQSQCRTAFDIKGADFRSRHKPPTKAMDFLASGVPFAINADSSPAKYCRSLGFEVASSEDTDYWLSKEYWRATQEFGRILESRLSIAAIAGMWANVLRSLLPF